MPLLLLKPTWPANRFQRTVVLKRDKKRQPIETKVFVFSKSDPVEVTADELAMIASDVGNAVFEVEYDQKNRVRYLAPKEDQETKPAATSPPTE